MDIKSQIVPDFTTFELFQINKGKTCDYTQKGLLPLGFLNLNQDHLYKSQNNPPDFGFLKPHKIQIEDEDEDIFMMEIEPESNCYFTFFKAQIGELDFDDDNLIEELYGKDENVDWEETKKALHKFWAPSIEKYGEYKHLIPPEFDTVDCDKVHCFSPDEMAEYRKKREAIMTAR